MDDRNEAMLTLSTLVYRFGSLFLRACDYQLPQAALLFWLCTSNWPAQWVALFGEVEGAYQPHPLLREVFSVPQLRQASSRLVDRQFLARLYTDNDGKFTFRDGDAAYVADIPHSAVPYLQAHPWPTIFVRVRPLDILYAVEPGLDTLIDASVQLRLQYAPVEVTAVVEDVALMLGGRISQWGVYPSTRAPLLERALHQAIAKVVARNLDYGDEYIEQETRAL